MEHQAGSGLLAGARSIFRHWYSTAWVLSCCTTVIRPDARVMPQKNVVQAFKSGPQIDHVPHSSHLSLRLRPVLSSMNPRSWIAVLRHTGQTRRSRVHQFSGGWFGA